MNNERLCDHTLFMRSILVLSNQRDLNTVVSDFFSHFAVREIVNLPERWIEIHCDEDHVADGVQVGRGALEFPSDGSGELVHVCFAGMWF